MLKLPSGHMSNELANDADARMSLRLQVNIDVANEDTATSLGLHADQKNIELANDDAAPAVAFLEPNPPRP